jgi:hypothetical protein
LADYIKSRGEKILLTEEQAQKILVDQALNDIADEKSTERFEEYREKLSLTEEQEQKILVDQSLKDEKFTEKFETYRERFETYQQEYEQKDKQQDQSQEILMESAKFNPKDSSLKKIFIECFGINEDTLNKINELFYDESDDSLYSEEKLLKTSLRLAEKQEEILKKMLEYQKIDSAYTQEDTEKIKKIEKKIDSLKSFVTKVKTNLNK